MVWYITPQGNHGQEATGEPSLEVKRLGRYLGPNVNVGDAMCGTVLTERGTRMDRTSIYPLTAEDKNSDPVRKRKEIFEKVLAEKLKGRVKSMKDGKDAATPDQLAKAWEKEETPINVPYQQWDPAELGFD